MWTTWPSPPGSLRHPGPVIEPVGPSRLFLEPGNCTRGPGLSPKQVVRAATMRAGADGRLRGGLVLPPVRSCTPSPTLVISAGLDDQRPP